MFIVHFVLIFIVMYPVIWFTYKWFKQRNSEKTLVTKSVPEPGELWGFLPVRYVLQGSPWQQKTGNHSVLVTIRDVKSGWVRYFHGKGNNSDSDSVMTSKDFCKLYSLYKSNK